MKRMQKISVLTVLILVISLALPTVGLAAGLGTKVVLGNTYTLAKGETLNEDLNIFGGTVTLEEGSTVNGNILVLGGNVSIAGQVNGNIDAAGGTINLLKTAVITGNIKAAGAILSQDEGALVKGTISNEDNITIIDQSKKIPFPNFRNVVSPILNVLSFLVWVFILSALSVLIVMFLPSQNERVNQAVMTQPLISFGFGLITLVVAPFAMLAMAITLILIPAVPLLAFVLLALIFMGWIACGYEVGRRFTAMIHQEWAAPIVAGLGTLLLTFVLGSLAFIPCVGWLPIFVVACTGLGAVFLTRGGTRTYTPTQTAPPAGPAPAAPTPGPQEPVRMDLVPPVSEGTAGPEAAAEPEAPESPEENPPAAGEAQAGEDQPAKRSRKRDTGAEKSS